MSIQLHLRQQGLPSFTSKLHLAPFFPPAQSDTNASCGSHDGRENDGAEKVTPSARHEDVKKQREGENHGILNNLNIASF